MNTSVLALQDCIAFARQILTARRYQHSLGVMQVMNELAPIYGLDGTQAMVAGILHDIAKEFTPDRLVQLATEYNIPLRTEYDRYPLFLHGPIGACYVAREAWINDPIVLDAIARHSYFGEGAALSTAFCWCLRFADMLEPARDWQDLRNKLKPLVYAGRMGEGARHLMEWVIPFHESKSLPVHPNLRRLAQQLSNVENEKRLSEIDSLPV